MVQQRPALQRRKNLRSFDSKRIRSFSLYGRAATCLDLAGPDEGRLIFIEVSGISSAVLLHLLRLRPLCKLVVRPEMPSSNGSEYWKNPGGSRCSLDLSISTPRASERSAKNKKGAESENRSGGI